MRTISSNNASQNGSTVNSHNFQIHQTNRSKNTLQIIEKVKDITLNEDELVVTALYPNVPIPLAMKLLNGWLKSIGLEKHEVAMYSELPQRKSEIIINKELSHNIFNF
jgi:hypothetical protein